MLPPLRPSIAFGVSGSEQTPSGDLTLAPDAGASIGFVHVRRALLLFAIVLALAAIVASVSQSPEESGERESPPPARSGLEDAPRPTVSPGTATAPVVARELVFDAARDQTRRLDAGQPATVLVEVDEPGLVEIADLGLSAPAQPLTPARFEVLTSDPRRIAITFTPVQSNTPDEVGTLVVRETADG